MTQRHFPPPGLTLEQLEDRTTPAGSTIPAGEFNWMQFSPSGELAQLVWEGQTLVYRTRVANAWQEEPIATTGIFTNTQYNSRDQVEKATQSAQLLFTSDGTPHVLFLDPQWNWQSNGYQTVVRDYARVNGQWQLVGSMTAPWLSNWGPNNLVAEAGANNSIHLLFTETYAYATGVENQGSGILWYATNKSGTWTFDKIADTADMRQDVWFIGGRWAPRFLSMAIDGQNNAHVTYTPRFYIAGAFSTVQSTLMYATNRGGSWHSETIIGPQDGTADAGLGASIAVAPNGQVAVASYYVDRYSTGSPQTSKLMYHVRNANGSWTHSDVVTTPDGYVAGDGPKFTGFSPQLYFDNLGRPTIVFSDEAGQHLPVTYANEVSGQIRTATLVNGHWQLQTVFRQTNPLVNQIFYPIAATNGSTTAFAGLQSVSHLDANGNPTSSDYTVIDVGAPPGQGTSPPASPLSVSPPTVTPTPQPINSPSLPTANSPGPSSNVTSGPATTGKPVGLAVGSDAGVQTTVAVYRTDGSLDFTLTPFGDGYTGGARVARADVTGDGIPDVIVGSGGGIQARVRIWDGATHQLIFDSTPFEDFSGGVVVAAGDINGDGTADVAIAPDAGGGPRLQLLYGRTFTKMTPDFFGLPYPDFRGGLRLAVGDVNHDGFADVIVAPGEGGGPRITLYDGRTIGPGKNPAPLVNDFFIFDASLRTGFSLAAGDVNGDGYADIIAGVGQGGSPRVRVISGADLAAGRGTNSVTDFTAGANSDLSGVRVSVRDYDGDGQADVVVGSGAGSFVRTYTGRSLVGNPNPIPAESFEVFPGVPGGAYVG
jgi:hypothetical protein